MRLTILFAGLFVVAATASQATEPMRLRVTPEVSVEPAYITIYASIEPDAGNRRMSIEIDSDAFFRSSDVEIDGDRAPRVSVFRYRELPAGAYEVRLVLFGRDGRAKGSASQFLTVLP